MKEKGFFEAIGVYSNWRIDILGLLAAVALILFASEGETMAAAVWSKVAAIAIWAATAALGVYWKRAGKINELTGDKAEE